MQSASGVFAIGNGVFNIKLLAPSFREQQKVTKMAKPDEVTITVCLTCRKRDEAGEYLPDIEGEVRPGRQLFDTLTSYEIPEGVNIRGVKCLTACKNGCAITLTGDDRWSYIYGNLEPAEHASDILAGAAAYAATKDGLVPWRERPVIFRKQSIARIPPASFIEPE